MHTYIWVTVDIQIYNMCTYLVCSYENRGAVCATEVIFDTISLREQAC